VMAEFRAGPPAELAGIRVAQVRDYENQTVTPVGGKSGPLAGPKGDLVFFDLATAGNYVACRPSGTEPKIKFYLFAFEPAEMLAPDGQLSVLLVVGVNGVGKTTLSVAAALHFGKSRRTILFTTDPASNLDDLLAANGQRSTANVTIEALKAEDLYAKFLEKNLANFLELGDRGTYLDKDELRRFFELSLPGVDELMAWLRIGELAEENEDALLVVDTAPTGHTLRMLGSAEHFRQFAAALESMQVKHRQLVRQLPRRVLRDFRRVPLIEGVSRGSSAHFP